MASWRKHYCSGRSHTIRELLECAGALAGRSALLQFGALEARSDGQPDAAGDPGLLRGLGWCPAFPDLRAGLGQTLTARGLLSTHVPEVA